MENLVCFEAISMNAQFFFNSGGLDHCARYLIYIDTTEEKQGIASWAGGGGAKGQVGAGGGREGGDLYFSS